MGNELTADQVKHVSQEAKKAFEDLRIGAQSNDLKQVIEDVEKARQSMSPKEYDAFLKELTKETQKMLPNVEIVGVQKVNGESELVITDRNHEKTNLVDKDDVIELAQMRGSKDIGKVENRNGVIVESNDQGELTRITRQTAQGEQIWAKAPDGKWIVTNKDGSLENDLIIGDVTVDDKGALHYTMIDKSKVIEHADGRNQYIETDGSGITYGSGKNYARPEETADGKGRGRKFQYDDKNQVQEIEGNLGHWERQTNDKGKTVWVNRDSKAVWEGDFKVLGNGDLIFTGHSGVKWRFTRNGKDILEKRRSA